ncbi:MAG: hypothetical protein ACK4OK_02860, partial [Thermoflexus sp.]
MPFGGTPSASHTADWRSLDSASNPRNHAPGGVAVAATKSYFNSIVAGLAVLAEWVDDDALRSALRDLPTVCRKAVAL